MANNFKPKNRIFGISKRKKVVIAEAITSTTNIGVIACAATLIIWRHFILYLVRSVMMKKNVPKRKIRRAYLSQARTKRRRATPGIISTITRVKKLSVSVLYAAGSLNCACGIFLGLNRRY